MDQCRTLLVRTYIKIPTYQHIDRPPVLWLKSFTQIHTEIDNRNVNLSINGFLLKYLDIIWMIILEGKTPPGQGTYFEYGIWHKSRQAWLGWGKTIERQIGEARSGLADISSAASFVYSSLFTDSPLSALSSLPPESHRISSFSRCSTWWSCRDEISTKGSLLYMRDWEMKILLSNKNCLNNLKLSQIIKKIIAFITSKPTSLKILFPTYQ